MDKSQQAVAVFDSCAAIYQEKYMDVGLYKDSFDLFCSKLQQDSEILELACGPGNITHYLLEKRPDLKILGTDLAPNMVALARINNPAADFELMDCRKITEINKKFDAVMCGFCLPYLSKEEAIQLLKDTSGIINPGGLIYISTMEDDYEKSRLQTSSSGEYTLFMHFHEADYLTKVLEANGFSIIDLQRIPFPAADGNTTTDLIIIAENSL